MIPTSLFQVLLCKDHFVLLIYNRGELFLWTIKPNGKLSKKKKFKGELHNRSIFTIVFHPTEWNFFMTVSMDRRVCLFVNLL